MIRNSMKTLDNGVLASDEIDDQTSKYEPFSEISKSLLARAKADKKTRKRSQNIDGSDGPHIVDSFVGAQLKKLRGSRGLSQQSLAQKLGLTFQQVQKYEGGKNRLSASRMYEISMFLGVEPAYFFDGVERIMKSHTLHQGATAALGEDASAYQPEEDIMAKTESIRMMASFYSIPDEKVRVAVRALVKRIANSYGQIDKTDDD